MASDVLKKLLAFGLSLISGAIFLKNYGIGEWETSAYAGGAILFFVIMIIINKQFKTDILPSMFFAGLITAFIMFMISPSFSIIMFSICLFIIAIIIFLDS